MGIKSQHAMYIRPSLYSFLCGLNCFYVRVEFHTVDSVQLCSVLQELAFGRLKIPKGQVFAATEQSYAFVNLKPIVPGMSSYLFTVICVSDSAGGCAALVGRRGECCMQKQLAKLSQQIASMPIVWKLPGSGLHLPVHNFPCMHTYIVAGHDA